MKQEHYPKTFKYRGMQQNGMIGQFRMNNGLITIKDETEHEAFKALPLFKNGQAFELGTGMDLLIDEQTGGLKKIVVNRFSNAFSDEELQRINKIPQDVWDNDVLFNIREIMKEYEGEEEPEAIEPDGAPPADNPGELLPLPEGKMTVKKLQEYLETSGITYPNDAKKADLYALYAKDFAERAAADAAKQ